jgi:hypothetical protein
MSEEVVRNHKEGYLAVHLETGEMFGGKAAGTHIAYPRLRDLRAAMTHAKVSKEDYAFFRLSFNKGLLPTVIQVQ